jgi:nickel-type superoxide dismutase maturation protease
MTSARYPRLLFIIAAGAVVALAWRDVIRVEVQGESMAPTLRPGDRMLALVRFRGRPGDIVAVRDPRLPSRILVKRVATVEADRSLRLHGDDPDASTDSRSFGPVSATLVLGRVVWRYWPPDRRGNVEDRATRKVLRGFR